MCASSPAYTHWLVAEREKRTGLRRGLSERETEEELNNVWLELERWGGLSRGIDGE